SKAKKPGLNCAAAQGFAGLRPGREDIEEVLPVAAEQVLRDEGAANGTKHNDPVSGLDFGEIEEGAEAWRVDGEQEARDEERAEEGCEDRAGEASPGGALEPEHFDHEEEASDAHGERHERAG